MTPSVVHTVAQVTAHIKGLFAEDEILSNVWISGEVSNFKQATSGHCYFTLKDATSSMRAVIWRTHAHNLTLPRDGDAVLAHGYISVYEPRGDYQFYVDHMQPGGTGWLWQEFQRLKARLEAEGLFDAERKRPLPPLPKRLGVVTSASGAALRDILRTLSQRLPMVEVLLAPAVVQGEQAPASIVSALNALNAWSQQRAHLDVIILARGGGSIEELWAFNDERVARAVAASEVPVIAGVGHETDFTIADFVADVRAPTPTGAATQATPDAQVLAEAVAGQLEAAEDRIDAHLTERRRELSNLRAWLARQSPQRRIAADRQRLDEMQRRSAEATGRLLVRWRERVGSQRQYLAGMHPMQVLERGYALVSKADGTLVRSTGQASAGEIIQIRVADGAFTAVTRKSQASGDV